MKRLTPVLALACLLAGGAIVAPPPAPAASTDARQNPWIRYHQPDVRVPAGEGCAFRVKEHVVRDREFYKVLATYDDGTHQAELFRGPLVMRYRNMHTGKSVVENLSGHGRVTYYRNGDFASLTVLTGHFGTSIGPGNEQARGLYRVGGRNSSLTLTHDGHRSIALGRSGTLESICPKIHGRPRA
jgi:hypothetical protein